MGFEKVLRSARSAQEQSFSDLRVVHALVSCVLLLLLGVVYALANDVTFQVRVSSGSTQHVSVALAPLLCTYLLVAAAHHISVLVPAFFALYCGERRRGDGWVWLFAGSPARDFAWRDIRGVRWSGSRTRHMALLCPTRAGLALFLSRPAASLFSFVPRSRWERQTC